MRFLATAIVAVALSTVLVACSNDTRQPNFQFTVTKDGETIAIDDNGTRPIVPFATPPYLTLNFGAGDPYVAVGLNTQKIVLGQKLQFPAAMFIQGHEVVVHIAKTDYDSKKVTSTGYLIVKALQYTPSPESIILDAELSAELADGGRTVSVKGTMQYRK